MGRDDYCVKHIFGLGLLSVWRELSSASRDVIILSIVAVGSWLLIVSSEADSRFHDWAVQHSAHAIDHVILAFILFSLCTTIFATRRFADQRAANLARDAAEQHLLVKVFEDPLTGLLNRIKFQRLVEDKLTANSETQAQSAVFYLDLDGFKYVNDTFGHSVGDVILQKVTQRLHLAMREVNLDDARTEDVLICRMGGDEFTIFLNNFESPALPRKIAQRILRAMAEPFELGSKSISISCSIGVAMSPEFGFDFTELLRAADAAMYHAKNDGKNCVTVYSKALDDDALRLSNLEQGLRTALADDQFELYFQPVFDSRTLKISSAEALIRWNHPTSGLIMPDTFIPLAEKLNIINDIGEWVLIEAIKRIAKWSGEGIPIKLSINVSPNQLRQMEFAALVKASLAYWKAKPELLELEVTESAFMEQMEMAADRFTRLSSIGVSLAMDDFGTGYSNLAKLTQLPFKRLKLDRSLLTGLVERNDKRTLVHAIVALASGLNLQSVVEGVETEEQLSILRVMGCDHVQGYLLSKPLKEAEFVRLLEQQAFEPMQASGR
ncbi:GGDEF-domain containing protein [Sphingopyxis sp. BSNA05]|nr:EAL domain-containing protein [Sphingopyxis sp. BSNA05]NRD89351.1 GGDEF-domain containing protein [Sphingopyxis sp. BSNA05]